MPVAATSTLSFTMAGVMANEVTSTISTPFPATLSASASSSLTTVIMEDMLTTPPLAAAVAATSNEAKPSSQIQSVTTTTKAATAVACIAASAQCTIATDTVTTQLIATTHTSSKVSTLSPVSPATSSRVNGNAAAIINAADVLPTSVINAAPSVSSRTSVELLLDSLGVVCVTNSTESNCQQQQHHNILPDDTSALQLALELSMVGLNDASTTPSSAASVPTTTTMQYLQNLQQLPHQHICTLHNLQKQQQVAHSEWQQQLGLNKLSVISSAVATAAAAANQQQQLNNNSNICSLSSPTASTTANTGSSNPLHGNHHSLPFGVVIGSTLSGSATGLLPPTLEDRSKKSQNMTECVPVPSSEHVAEIVGRQGCKIKALRAKTNTYIKTPVRGEEPVFVVTGRKEDVSKAKREILSAAEHFSLIRATRKPSYDGRNISLMNIIGHGSGHGIGGSGVAGAVVIAGTKSPPGPPCISGQVTIKVRVPYRVVGLVVGPKGATIKHIQQQTQTYIVTPSREKEPIFEVTGLPDNVQAARKQIEAHIALRTGNFPTPAGPFGSAVGIVTSGTGAIGDGSTCFVDPTLHTINTLSEILNDDINPDFLASLYKNAICSTFDYVDSSSNLATAATSNNAHVSLCAPGLNLNSQQLSLGPTLVGNNQQQQYSNDCLHSILGSNNGLLDVDLQPQHLHVQQQQHIPQHMGHSCKKAMNNVDSLSLSAIGIGSQKTTAMTVESAINSNGITRPCSSASSTTSSKSVPHSNSSVAGCLVSGVGGGGNGDVISSNSSSSSSNSSTASSRPELMNIWKELGDSVDVDEGIGESPSIWTTNLTTAAIATVSLAPLNGTHSSPIRSNSSTDSLLGEINITVGTGKRHRCFESGIGITNIGSVNCSNNIFQLQHQHQHQHLFRTAGMETIKKEPFNVGSDGFSMLI